MSNSRSGNKGHAGGTGSGNDTGKTGNASGSHVKEARGPSYEPPPSDQEHRGKHPPNKIYTGPKDMHPHPDPRPAAIRQGMTPRIVAAPDTKSVQQF